VLAIASNQSPLPDATVPMFALNDAHGIAAFIIHHCATLNDRHSGHART
jgi:hypothetical protein